MLTLVYGSPDASIDAEAEGWEVFPGSVERARADAHPAPWGTWFVVAERTLIGVCGFHGPPKEGVVEIGYAVAPGWRGRGLGLESAAALIAIAGVHPEVEAVIAHTLPTDGPSTAILGRLGFVPDGDSVDPEEGPVRRWRRARHPADGFFGTWELLEARYEAGHAPTKSRFVHRPRLDAILFELDWEDEDHGARHMEFELPFGDVNGLEMERVDKRTLDTRVATGFIRSSRRTLSPELTRMEIVQDGVRKDGTPFANRASYRRVSWAWRG